MPFSRNIAETIRSFIGTEVTVVVCNRDPDKVILTTGELVSVTGDMKLLTDEVVRVKMVNFKYEAVNLIRNYDRPDPTIYLDHMVEI
ncbi:MAG: hypothetical protein AAB916_00975 [Patescibacteria group bacterium]